MNTTTQNYVCNYCNSHSIVEQSGYIVCRDCGTVLDRVFKDSSFEMYAHNDRKSTQAINIGKRLTKVGSLGSEIGYYNQKLYQSYDGKKLPPHISQKFRRLTYVYHSPAKNASIHTHLRTFMIFNKICANLEIPTDIKERSSFLYWKYEKVYKSMISNHVLLIALCLLYAIKESQARVPLKFQEVVGAFNTAGHRVTNKNILALASEINLKLNSIPVRKSEDYLSRITETIATNEMVKARIARYKTLNAAQYSMLLLKISTHFLSTLSTRDRGGRRPYGFSVAVVYLADRAIARYMKKSAVLTQKLIADITTAKEYTIRDHCYNNLTNWFEKIKEELFSIIRDYFSNSIN